MYQLLSRFTSGSKLQSPSNNAALLIQMRRFDTRPYLTIGSMVNKVSTNGTITGGIQLFDPTKEKLMTVLHKTLPKELVNTRHIGSSQGWGLFRGEVDHSYLCLSDFYNPFARKSYPNVIPLPSFTTLPNCQTEIVRDVAMSSDSPSMEQDFVVAVKFLGGQISFFKHGRDSGWTNLEVPFRSMDYSKLMYSKRDQGFYLPGGTSLLKWDHNFKEKDYHVVLRKLVIRDSPELSHSEYSCFKAEQWVESSSGESFLIQWYSDVSSLPKREDPTFIVFRKEETTEGKYMCYTEDIEDFCIFLSDSHPFCVEASSYPGLEPNSIYHISPEGFGLYNLTTKTSRYFKPPRDGRDGPISVAFHPYWLPPSTI